LLLVLLLLLLLLMLPALIGATIHEGLLHGCDPGSAQ